MTVWLTTAPDPRRPATGHDAGQRGWRLHAVVGGTALSTLDELRRERAACGLRPAHGWGLDGYIEDKCARCLRALAARAASTETESNRCSSGETECGGGSPASSRRRAS